MELYTFNAIFVFELASSFESHQGRFDGSSLQINQFNQSQSGIHGVTISMVMIHVRKWWRYFIFTFLKTQSTNYIPSGSDTKVYKDTASII